MAEEDIFADGECVKVCARIRPINALEKANGNKVCVQCFPDGKTISIQNELSEHTFKFDTVFPAYTNQETMYQAVARPLLSSVMDGINGAIIAYGQTGSGKTFTMQGPDDDADTRGLIPRLFTEMFDIIRHSDGVDYDVRLSCIEIYNEVLHDLLRTGKSHLQIYEDRKRGLVITGASEVPVETEQEALEAYHLGLSNRRTEETKMNAESSRSHSICLVTIAKREHNENVTKFSQFYLVDLAGSEKVWKTGADGTRLEEAKFINKSLLALGQVIYKLSSKDAQHIPYRDSKLTRLLQNSLGGNARTVLNINVSPSEWNALESLSTLRFGHATKRIQNTPTTNQVMGIEELEAVLKAAHKRIALNSVIIEQLEMKRDSFRVLFQALGLADMEVAAIEKEGLKAKPRAKGTRKKPKTKLQSAKAGSQAASKASAASGAGAGAGAGAVQTKAGVEVVGTSVAAASPPKLPEAAAAVSAARPATPHVPVGLVAHLDSQAHAELLDTAKRALSESKLSSDVLAVKRDAEQAQALGETQRSQSKLTRKRSSRRNVKSSDATPPKPPRSSRSSREREREAAPGGTSRPSSSSRSRSRSRSGSRSGTRTDDVMASFLDRQQDDIIKRSRSSRSILDEADAELTFAPSINPARPGSASRKPLAARAAEITADRLAKLEEARASQKRANEAKYYRYMEATPTSLAGSGTSASLGVGLDGAVARTPSRASQRTSSSRAGRSRSGSRQ